MITQMQTITSLAEKNEKALLGSVVISPKMLDTISVTGAHFLDSRFGALFSLVRSIHDQGMPIDHVTLWTEIQKSRLDWSLADLKDLFSFVPNASNAHHYQNGVLEAYRRRILINVAERLQASASDMLCETESTVAEVENQLDALSVVKCNHTLTMQEACEQAYEQIFSKDKSTTSRMVGTGIAEMDQCCGLISGGEMVVLAARPACGKTALALQIAQHCGERERHVLIASLEMGADELVRRAVSSQTGVSNKELKGELRDSEAGSVKRALQEISNLDITLFVPPHTTLRKIRAAAKLQAARSDLRMIIVDYLGLIQNDGKSRGKYEDTTLISQGIKALARELKVPVLVLCQLSRQAEGETPMLKHLRDSGAIEQDADRVIFLEPHNWSPVKRTDFNIIIAKNRGGETGRFHLKFEGSRMKFSSAKVHQEFVNC